MYGVHLRSRLIAPRAAIVGGLAAACAVGLAWSRFGGQSAQAAAIGYSCARQAGVLLPAQAIGENMSVISSVSEAQPPNTGRVVGSTAPSVAPYSWFRDVNEQLRGTPPDFGLNTPSPEVTTEPLQVVQETETIQSFPSSAVAAKFLAMFAAPAANAAELEVSGVLRHVTFSVTALHGLGDRAIAVDSGIPGTQIPRDVQFVMQTGSVVTTVELVGGSQITPQRELWIAQRAGAQLAAHCPALAAGHV